MIGCDVVEGTRMTINARVAPYVPTAKTGIRWKGGIKQTAFYPVLVDRAQAFRIHNTYLKPWTFDGVESEYEALSHTAGLLDVTGEEVVEISGPDALELVNRVLVRDVRKIEDGDCRYAIMCYEHGGIVEDAVFARFSADRFWWVGGPAPAEEWFYRHSLGLDVTVRSYLDELHVASVQGPAARTILQKVTDYDLATVKYYGLAEATVCGVPVTITRTGFTGELGYDIYVDVPDAEQLFRQLLGAGAGDGLVLCGSAALDRRRIEAGIVNVGQDFGWNTTPAEAGLDWMVDFEKGPFVGRETLLRLAEDGPARKIVGLRADVDQEIGLATAVSRDGSQVGVVTSGTLSSAVGGWIGLAMLERGNWEPGTSLEIGGVDDAVPAITTALPFLDPKRERAKA